MPYSVLVVAPSGPTTLVVRPRGPRRPAGGSGSCPPSPLGCRFQRRVGRTWTTALEAALWPGRRSVERELQLAMIPAASPSARRLALQPVRYRRNSAVGLPRLGTVHSHAGSEPGGRLHDRPQAHSRLHAWRGLARFASLPMDAMGTVTITCGVRTSEALASGQCPRTAPSSARQKFCHGWVAGIDVGHGQCDAMGGSATQWLPHGAARSVG